MLIFRALSLMLSVGQKGLYICKFLLPNINVFTNVFAY